MPDRSPSLGLPLGRRNSNHTKWRYSVWLHDRQKERIRTSLRVFCIHPHNFSLTFFWLSDIVMKCLKSNIHLYAHNIPLGFTIIFISSLTLFFRALQSQIDDLEVHCSHGLSWSTLQNEYIPDPNRCTQLVKYGERKEHEDVCEFALVYCPNDEKHCGKFKRKDLAAHLQTCGKYSCQHGIKGTFLMLCFSITCFLSLGNF